MKLCQVIFFLLLPVLGIAKLSDDTRISNGYDAAPGDFPYITSYQYAGAHTCAATIISSYWLLTSAHCIYLVEQYNGFNINNLNVVGGITNLYLSPATRQVRAVRQQFKHHRFVLSTLVNDIGLVVVWNGFTLSNGVSSVRYTSAPINAVAIIAGWGYLRSTYPDPSPQLQYAAVKPITNSDCYQRINIPNVVISNEMICVVGNYKLNETTCNGDSGGPLLQQFGNYIQQVGVLSWDLKPCGYKDKPSVSTIIYPFLSWIDCIIYYQNTTSCRHL